MARTSICLWNPLSFKLFLARLSLLQGRYYGGHVISTSRATLLFFCRRRWVPIQTRAVHETNLASFLSLTQQVSWSQLASGGLLVFNYYSTVQAFQKISSSSALLTVLQSSADNYLGFFRLYTRFNCFKWGLVWASRRLSEVCCSTSWAKWPCSANIVRNVLMNGS